MTWIQTYTGKKFDLLDPKIDMICIEDIAHALSNLCRFNGHTKGFYPVAIHSIIVSYLIKPGLEMYGLLHDAAEAYVGDVTSPLKDLTGFTYKDIEKRIQNIIYYKYLSHPRTFEKVLIEKADKQALRIEAESALNKPPIENWHLEYPEADIDELVRLDMVKWGSKLAEIRFMERFEELTVTI